jgi:hypothetical protein
VFEVRSEMAKICQEMADKCGEHALDDDTWWPTPKSRIRSTAPITATAVDRASLCADAQRAAMRGGLLDLIELGLLAVGAGPTLEFADATVSRRVRDRDWEGAQTAAAMMDGTSHRLHAQYRCLFWVK